MDDNDVTCYLTEYRHILKDCDESNPTTIEQALVRKADWTPEAAQHLVQLARNYGAFILRNATALAVALDIEDGELGF